MNEHDEEESDGEVIVRIPVDVELYLAGVPGSVIATGMCGMDFDHLMGNVEKHGLDYMARAIGSVFDDGIVEELKHSYDDLLVFQNPLTGALFRAKKDNVIAFTVYPPAVKQITAALDEAASPTDNS